MVFVALRDDLEREVGLRGIHGQHGEIVDDEEVDATVATESALELAVVNTTRRVAWQTR